MSENRHTPPGMEDHGCLLLSIVVLVVVAAVLLILRGIH